MECALDLVMEESCDLLECFRACLTPPDRAVKETQKKENNIANL